MSDDVFQDILNEVKKGNSSLEKLSKASGTKEKTVSRVAKQVLGDTAAEPSQGQRGGFFKDFTKKIGFDKLKSTVGKATGEAGAAEGAAARGAAGAAEGAAAGATRGMAAVGTAAAGAATVVLALAAAAVIGYKKLRAWSDETIESQKGLAQFNNRIAGSYARSDLRNIQRQIRSGEKTAESLDNLIEANEDLKDQWQGVSDSWTNLFNNVGSKLERGVKNVLEATGIPKFLEGIADGINALLGEEKKKNQWKYTPAEQFFLDRAAGKQNHDDLFQWQEGGK